MSNKISPVAAVGRKLGHELREFALIFAYLYACFGAIMLYKTAILRGQGIDYTPYGFAVVIGSSLLG